MQLTARRELGEQTVDDCLQVVEEMGHPEAEHRAEATRCEREREEHGRSLRARVRGAVAAAEPAAASSSGPVPEANATAAKVA